MDLWRPEQSWIDQSGRVLAVSRSEIDRKSMQPKLRSDAAQFAAEGVDRILFQQKQTKETMNSKTGNPSLAIRNRHRATTQLAVAQTTLNLRCLVKPSLGQGSHPSFPSFPSVRFLLGGFAVSNFVSW